VGPNISTPVFGSLFGGAAALTAVVVAITALVLDGFEVPPAPTPAVVLVTGALVTGGREADWWAPTSHLPAPGPASPAPAGHPKFQSDAPVGSRTEGRAR
jgi:hypothetical protein